MNSSPLAGLAAAAVALAGLVVTAGPAPDAHACRPVAGSTEGLAFCNGLYSSWPPRTADGATPKPRKVKVRKAKGNAHWTPVRRARR